MSNYDYSWEEVAQRQRKEREYKRKYGKWAFLF
jgi:hypothetical protein